MSRPRWSMRVGLGRTMQVIKRQGLSCRQVENKASPIFEIDQPCNPERRLSRWYRDFHTCAPPVVPVQSTETARFRTRATPAVWSTESPSQGPENACRVSRGGILLPLAPSPESNTLNAEN